MAVREQQRLLIRYADLSRQNCSQLLLNYFFVYCLKSTKGEWITINALMLWQGRILEGLAVTDDVVPGDPWLKFVLPHLLGL